MCTSIVYNGKKTIVGWNLDVLDMKHRVMAREDSVYIEIHDKTEGWLPLFGANVRGDFVAMPTCWPHDARSDLKEAHANHIIKLDIDLLTGQKSFAEVKKIAESEPIYSVPGVTFQAQLSDKNGNVLQIIPGQGIQYMDKPRFSVMTNFSPLQRDCEKHPWMGLDRYQTAVHMLELEEDKLNVEGCFEILKATAQLTCPTVVSMVYDVTDHMVYWCEHRNWDRMHCQKVRES